jgi:hypothetical protein
LSIACLLMMLVGLFKDCKRLVSVCFYRFRPLM